MGRGKDRWVEGRTVQEGRTDGYGGGREGKLRREQFTREGGSCQDGATSQLSELLPMAGGFMCSLSASFR